MKQEANNSKNTIIIGKSADGADIKINTSEFNSVINQQLELLLKKNININDIQTQQSQIDKLKPQEENTTKDINLPAWAWILISSIVGAVIFIFAMILFQKGFGFGIQESSTSIILGFVGIAATFVVVSNYAQVKEVEGKFNEKTKEIERMFDIKVHESINRDTEIAGLVSKFADTTQQTKEDINSLYASIKGLHEGEKLIFEEMKKLLTK